MDRPENKSRLENLYKQLLEMANGNFSQRIERTDNKDDLEALTALVNLVTERVSEFIIGLGYSFINISPRKKVLEDRLQMKVFEQFRKSPWKSGAAKPDKIGLLPADLENIRSAREYIKKHIDGPLLLKDLAHSIGTNEFKLKMGFRELYGMTVFQFIKDYRLRKAYVLVLYTDMTIGSIANLTGFKQPNHLSREFKKRYGRTPRGLRKSSTPSKTENSDNF